MVSQRCRNSGMAHGILVSYGAMRIVILIAVLALSVSAQAQTTAFVGGRVIDVTGRAIENGIVVISGGKITAVGPASTPVPAGATRVDLKGQKKQKTERTRPNAHH